MHNLSFEDVPAKITGMKCLLDVVMETIIVLASVANVNGTQGKVMVIMDGMLRRSIVQSIT